MTDHILKSFLENQYREGMALAAESDLLTLTPLDGDPPQRYVAEFRCTGLVREPSGAIVEADRFEVGIWFSDRYLRVADTFSVLTWLAPSACWHPNIGNRSPFVCIGRLVAGTPLPSILYQLFELITYNRLNTHDRLNEQAAAWARRNLDRFPVDRRPLKRSTAAQVDLDVVEIQP